MFFNHGVLAGRAPGAALGQATRTWEVRRGVLAAVLALHMAGVVHGDLEPCNILVATTDPVHLPPLLAVLLRLLPSGVRAQDTRIMPPHHIKGAS